MAASLLAGCDLLAVKEQQARMNAYCQFRGNVKPEVPVNTDLIVVLLRHQGDSTRDKTQWSLADHFVLDGPGDWMFYTKPGTYYFTAFEDLNRDGVFERDEPAIPPRFEKTFSCTPGEAREGLDLVIPRDGRFPGDGPIDLAKLRARSAAEQLQASLGQALKIGEVVALGDPRFSRENARRGLWRPYDFLWEAKPGLYFLEPYNPAKTPVLFVHGITGSPTDFEYLIEHLDRTRFQPWVVYYPSGARLDKVGTYLDQMVTQLNWQYRLKRLAVVAHSMGGLVARSFILKHNAAARDELIPLFVSIASPWNGHPSAQIGVDRAPTPIRVWFDMAPGSPFLTGLYHTGETPDSERQHLPESTSHHLVFAFLPTRSGDGTVSLSSQLRREAQEEAARLYGIQQSHVGVLRDPETSELLNRVLSNSADAPP